VSEKRALYQRLAELQLRKHEKRSKRAKWAQEVEPLVSKLQRELKRIDTEQSKLDGASLRHLVPAVQTLARVLYTQGLRLCAASPSAFSCNNPLCRNLASVSKAFELVRGKGCVCGGCLTARWVRSAIAAIVAYS